MHGDLNTLVLCTSGEQHCNNGFTIVEGLIFCWTLGQAGRLRVFQGVAASVFFKHPQFVRGHFPLAEMLDAPD